MSATVVPHPNVDPEVIWPGSAAIDPTGATIARDLLEELESREQDQAGHSPSDYTCLQDWPRQGRPFRNAVAESAAAAQAAGPEALEAFYAVLSDYIGYCCSGSIPDSWSYDSLCTDDEAVT